MSEVVRYAGVVVAGGLLGALGGLLAAILLLWLKGLRNRRRMARGEAPYKDQILSPFWLPGAATGALAALGLAPLLGLRWAAFGALLSFPLLLYGLIYPLGLLWLRLRGER